MFKQILVRSSSQVLEELHISQSSFLQTHLFCLLKLKDKKKKQKGELFKNNLRIIKYQFHLNMFSFLTYLQIVLFSLIAFSYKQIVAILSLYLMCQELTYLKQMHKYERTPYQRRNLTKLIKVHDIIKLQIKSFKYYIKRKDVIQWHVAIKNCQRKRTILTGQNFEQKERNP